jgi:hypothetical protein
MLVWVAADSMHSLIKQISNYKQINKKYTKQYLRTKQTVPKDVTRRYERVSARIA